MLKVERDGVGHGFEAQAIFAPRDGAGGEFHDRAGAKIGQSEESAHRDELIQHLLVRIIDRFQALEHVLLRPAKIEHRMGVMGQEFLGAVGRIFVDFERIRIDQLPFVDAFDEFHQRSHW